MLGHDKQETWKKAVKTRTELDSWDLVISTMKKQPFQRRQLLHQAHAQTRTDTAVIIVIVQRYCRD